MLLAVWIGMALIGFWKCDQRDDRVATRSPSVWPEVVAIVPARDEADLIARSIASLAAQDYPGPFRIILVDDNSSDATASRVREIGSSRIEILDGAPLAAGWTGKLWAVSQGIAAAGSPQFVWLTDADIEHSPDTLRNLVEIATAGDFTLVSLMAKLRCRSLPERALIPSFIYFFIMLYPFNWVNRRGPVAAAAGGCVLVSRPALETAGGIAAIRGELIDDCALGRLLKRQGPVWLGLTDRSHSIRPYDDIGQIAAMIARSAFAQLHYSLPLAMLSVAALMLIFLAPPILALSSNGLVAAVAGATLLLMLALYQPILRFYRLSPFWALGLPLVMLFYVGCIIMSVVQHVGGRGGTWKGRTQALSAP